MSDQDKEVAPVSVLSGKASAETQNLLTNFAERIVTICVYGGPHFQSVALSPNDDPYSRYADAIRGGGRIILDPKQGLLTATFSEHCQAVRFNRTLLRFGYQDTHVQDRTRMDHILGTREFTVTLPTTDHNLGIKTRDFRAPSQEETVYQAIGRIAGEASRSQTADSALFDTVGRFANFDDRLQNFFNVKSNPFGTTFDVRNHGHTLDIAANETDHQRGYHGIRTLHYVLTTPDLMGLHTPNLSYQRSGTDGKYHLVVPVNDSNLDQAAQRNPFIRTLDKTKLPDRLSRLFREVTKDEETPTEAAPAPEQGGLFKRGLKKLGQTLGF